MKESREVEIRTYAILFLIVVIVLLCLKDGWDSKDAYDSGYKDGYSAALEDNGIEN